MDYNKIGEFIAKERKSKKMTQAKLAEKLFVSEKTISKWEQGKGVPDTENLPKLCEIFGVTLNELLAGERNVESNRSTRSSKYHSIYHNNSTNSQSNKNRIGKLYQFFETRKL